MFFNAKQHTYMISVFRDSMARIDADLPGIEWCGNGRKARIPLDFCKNKPIIPLDFLKIAPIFPLYF